MRITEEQMHDVWQQVIRQLEAEKFIMSDWFAKNVQRPRINKKTNLCNTACCIGGTMQAMKLLKVVNSNEETYGSMPDLLADQADPSSNLFNVMMWGKFSTRAYKALKAGYSRFDYLPTKTKIRIINMVFEDYIKKYYKNQKKVQE